MDRLVIISPNTNDFYSGLDQIELRNLMHEAVKKYLCLTAGSFKDFQRTALNFSHFDHSPDFFTSFLHQGRKEEPARLEGPLISTFKDLKTKRI